MQELAHWRVNDVLHRAVRLKPVLGVADINEAVLVASAVRMDDCFGCNATTNNGLQRSLFAVRHNLSIDLAISLEPPEEDGLSRDSAPALTAHTTRSEVRFIDFDLARREWRATFVILRHELTDVEKDRVGCFVRQTSQLSNVRRR